MHNTNIPCGCLIEYEGDQTHQDYSIDWCPLHASAPDLLEAVIRLVNDETCDCGKECDINQGLAAIAKATRGSHDQKTLAQL